MLTLADLRYLRRLVARDYYETRNYQQSERVEAKLTTLIHEKGVSHASQEESRKAKQTSREKD